ncbi:phage portal protein [Aeromicrobium fastidiosum]|uniref:phage portal protein n=1 Tax=Aeromicrobium fastidiosum TaxID=52699 RepID=UPI00165F4C2E|nr:phage portal protein [Aeromicrobium fastidiosum]MBP2392000.1 hypothetical protein [Aeromicrobium fastidiosum]
MSEIAELSKLLDVQESKVRAHEQRYRGEVPIAFLSPKARDALDQQLKVLSVNYSRLVVDALAERLKVVGFMIDGKHDDALWERWRAQSMQDGAVQAITDALATGRGFISVWGDDGQPTVTPEDPGQCIALRDPITREITIGMRRWIDAGKGHATVYRPWSVDYYTSTAGAAEGASLPSDGWNLVDSRPHPLGIPPLVQLTNRGRTADVFGISEMDAVRDLVDALTKVMIDAMVTSEYYARPRRWGTGIEVETETNDDGEEVAIDPFANSDRTWLAEAIEAKFGQFPTSDLAAYDTLSRTLLSQIASLGSLPAHYVFPDSAPTSGEEVKAKETSLTAKAESRITTFSRPFADVARLMVAIRDQRPVRSINAETVWADPATRTIAQDADGYTKMHAEGLISTEAALSRMGWSPEQIEDDRLLRMREQALRMAAGL